VTVRDVGGQQPLGASLDRFEAGENLVEARPADARLAAEGDLDVFGLEALDAVREFGDAVLETVDPALGLLAVGDGVRAALLLGLQLAFEVAFLLL